MSPLCCNKRERASVVAGRKSVCGLWSHGSRDSPNNCDLIEKKVREKNLKSSKLERFSPFFLRCHFVLINTSGRLQRRCKNPSVGWDIKDRATASKIAVLLKKGKWTNCSSAKTRLILTIFFASPVRCDDRVRAAAGVERNIVRGVIYQGGQERPFVCHGKNCLWLWWCAVMLQGWCAVYVALVVQ